MEDDTAISRRRFLKSTSAMTGMSILRIGAPALAALAQASCTARDDGAPLETLEAHEAADFAAIAARLIPTTDTPGATEAGVIHFYDRAWGAELSWALDTMRSFLQAINKEGGARFALLDVDAQDDVLKTHERDGRFELLRLTTIFGFFAMEKYGGNKNHASWDLIGFDGHHSAWLPPFGHYDAEYIRKQADGE